MTENPGQGSSPAENGRDNSPKRERGRTTRPDGMPGHGCFSRPVTHTHDGEEYQIEIWSAPGKWCIRLKADRCCFYGATEPEVLTAFIQAIDLEVEEGHLFVGPSFVGHRNSAPASRGKGLEPRPSNPTFPLLDNLRQGTR